MYLGLLREVNASAAESLGMTSRWVVSTTRACFGSTPNPKPDSIASLKMAWDTRKLVGTDSQTTGRQGKCWQHMCHANATLLTVTIIVTLPTVRRTVNARRCIGAHR